MQEIDPEDEQLRADHQARVLALIWDHMREHCPARFDKYSQIYGPDPLDKIAHYHWNTKVSEALLPTLGHCEILLRNSIDKVLVKKYGEMWFDGAFRLLEGENKALTKAKEDASRKEDMRGRLTNHDDIVSELSFRFWTNLLLSEYSRTVWNFLLIYGAFPNIPADLKDKRRAARLVFSDACDIRNRVCHGERVVHLPDLQQRQVAVVKAIGWMSKPTERIVKKLDAFPDCWANGLERCRQTLIEMVPDPPPPPPASDGT
jgi:hypothetical protein